MGTGKTCQAIAISRHYWRDWPALVLVPSSLRWIWAAELTRWLPELQQEDVCTVTGEDSARGVLLQAQERVAAAVPSDPKAPLKDDTLWPFAKATRRAAAAAAPPGTAGPSSGKARAAAAVPALTVMSYTLFQRWTDYVWSKRLTAEQQAWFRQANRRYSRQRAGYRSGGSAPPGEGATSSDKVHTSAQWAVGQVAGSFGSGSRGLHGALASSKAPGSREPDAVADGSTIGGSQRVAHSGKPSAFFDMLGRAVAQCMPTLICDEAHYLRDLSAQRTSSAVAVATHAKRVLLLTGTPAFARPIDIFPLLHALQPKAFPSKHAFGLRYCRGQMRTIRAGGGRRSAGGGFSVTKWTYEGASNSAELYAALESGVMVRRLKADVLKQLPPKQHQVVQLRLEGSQAIERMAGAMEKEVARLADWRHMQWQDAVAAAKEAASGAGGSPVKRQKGGAAGGRAGAGDGWDSGAELKPHLEAADAAGLLGGDGDLTSFNSSRDLTSFFSTAGKCTGKAMDASCLTSASSGTPQKSPPAMRRPPAGAARHSIPASFADDCLLQLAAANRVPGYASYGYSLALEAAAEEDEGVEGGLGDASDDEQGTRTAAETSFLAASSQYKPAVSGASAPITELSDPGDDDAEAVQVAELDPTGMDRWQATGVVKAPLVAQYLVQLLDGAGGGGAAGGGEGGDVTKVLVFAHHQAVLDTLQGELVKNKLVFVRIDGNCSMQERLASLKRFQREAAVVVALVSMTAGGEGLSYTAANVVLFAELHYVPGIMLQAEDRAHRLSSIAARNSAEFDNGGRVTIRYLLSHGTYDDTLWPRILKRLRGIGASVNGAEIDLKASLHRFVGKKLTDATQDTMSSGASASGVDGAGPAPGTQHTDVASGVDAATHTVTQNSAESRMAEQGEVLGVRSLLFRVDAVTGVARVYTQLGMYTGRHVATDDGALLSARPQDYPQVACNGAACLISKQRLFKTPAPAAVMAAAGLGGGAGHGAAPGGAHLLPLPSTRPPVPPAGCICWLAAAAVFAQQWCAMAPITQRELSGPLLRLPLDEQLKAVVRRDLGLDTSAVSLAEEGTDEGGVGGGAGAVASAASRHRITNERYAAMHSGVVPLSQVQQLAAANAADSDSSDSTDALMTQITGHSRGGQPNSAAASSGRLNDSVLPAAPPASGPAPVSCAHCGSELQHALALSVVGDGAQVLAQRALLQGGAGAAGGKKRRRPTIFALLSDSSSDDASDTSESDTGDGAEGQGGGGAQGQVLGEGGVASREALAGLADSAQVDPTKLYVLPFCNDKCSKAYWGRRKSDRIRAYVGQLEMGVCQLCGFRARDVWRHVASLHRSELQQLQEASARARLRLRRQCRRATAESALVKQELPNAFPQLRSAEAGVLDSIARASTATLRALLRCRRAYKRSQRALQDAKRTAATDRGDFLRRLSRKQWTAPARFGSTWPCAHKCQGLGWRPRAREGDVYVSPGLALDPNEGAFWQADHLLPVVEGGGASGWCNLRTLCTECHREVTSALRRRMSVLGTGRGGKGGAVLDKVALMRQAAREGGAGAASLGTAGVRSGSLPGMFKRARHNASGDSSAGSPGQLLRAEFGTAGRAGKATSQHGAGRGQEDEEVFVDLVSSDDEIFHGVNVVYKLPPFYPDLAVTNSNTSMTEEDMAQLHSWGFNSVRLGVMWSATAPDSPETFNTTFLSIVHDLIDRMGEYNIYTIVDAHQDLFSRKFCGEGVPDWAVQPGALTSGTFPLPLPRKVQKDPANGYTNITQCLEIAFVDWNAAAELQSSWYPLYHNRTLQSHFASFWGAVAREMNASQYVLGYELMNEPLPCDGYHNLDVLCYLDPKKTDVQNLLPLYQAAWGRIRESDTHHIVMYEPSVIEGDIHQATGFEVGPGGVDANATQAFAYHVYCFNQDAAGDITNMTVCDNQMKGTFAMTQADIARVGGGHFVTEFGALGDGSTSVEAIHHQTAVADTFLESWAYWTYKGFQDITTQNPATESFFHPNGTLQTAKVAALSRTYAQRVAGVPGSITMQFAGEAVTKDFALAYTTNGGAKNTTTVVYLNEDWHYPAGYTLQVTPQGALAVSQPGRNYIHLTHKPGVQLAVTVSITAQ